MSCRHAPLLDLSWLLKLPLSSTFCCTVSRWFPLRPDVLDLLIYVEMACRTPFDRAALIRMLSRRTPLDFTAGEVHNWACSQLRVLGKPVPPSS